MHQAKFDVLAVGNAIVDILASTTDEFLSRHGIAKGAMTLVDSFRAELLGKSMQDAVEASGGSAANTTVGIASFGGRAAFIGKVNDDRLGQVFAEDIRNAGVDFDATPVAGPTATASSHILVSPDGQRSMNTFLGCASDLHAPDMDAQMIADASILFIEGYLWDSPSTKAAIRTAIAHARSAGRKVALTLSDPFCVGRWREEFLELMKTDVDILFANEEEARSLFQSPTFDKAFQAFRSWGRTAAITRSAKGSVVVGNGAVHIIDAEPVDRVIDTTGAGDQFAAGFLFGLSRGLALDVCGRLGGIAAAEVISHFGPRPQVSLKALAVKAGLV